MDFRNSVHEFDRRHVTSVELFLQLVQVFLDRKNLTIHEHGEHQGQNLTKQEETYRSLINKSLTLHMTGTTQKCTNYALRLQVD